MNDITNRSNVYGNLRYSLSSKMMNDFFLQWLSTNQTKLLIENLISDVKKNSTLAHPCPIYLSTKSSYGSLIPPASPKEPRYVTEQLQQSKVSKSIEIEQVKVPQSQNSDKNLNLIGSYDNIKRPKKISDNKEIAKQSSKDPLNTKDKPENIPTFFNIETIDKEDKLKNEKIILANLSDLINANDLKAYCESLFGLHSKYSEAILNKIYNHIHNITEEVTNQNFLIESVTSSVVVDGFKQSRQISKTDFCDVYNRYINHKSMTRRAFNTFKQFNEKFIVQSDLLPYMKCLLKEHEGLSFLNDHPEFQVKYSDSVIMRVFYTNDVNKDNKLSFREFSKSNILQTFNRVCSEADINQVRDYFSYEHFYVLYCKFWEVDNKEHNFLIDKDEFGMYETHCLNTLAVDRIFQQIPRKFSSQVKDKMNFEDFLCKIYDKL